MIEPLIRWHRPPTEPADPGLLDEIRSRPLRYPLGSGEAEEVALLARLKPMIRQRLSPERARERREFYRQRGLATDEIPLPGLPELTLLIAGWNAPQVEEAADCERDMYGERSTEERILTLGRLLGYPRCCVEGFLEVPGDRENEGLLRAATRRTEGPGDPWLNVLDLHVFHLISWTPCSFRCELSGRYAARVAGLLRPHFRPFLLNIHRALAHARLYLHDRVQISLEGELRPDGYWPLHALPTARDRSPSSVLDPAAEQDAAHALHAVRNARCIQSQGDLILLDGEPWAPGFLATFQGLARGLGAPFGVFCAFRR